MRTLLAAAAILAAGPGIAAQDPLTIRDLVMMERVSDPRVSPDGRHVAYALRETQLPENKGVKHIRLLDLQNPGRGPWRFTAGSGSSSEPRWSADGRSVFFLSTRSGSSQVWRLDLNGGEAQAVTDLPLDVNAFVLAPDGRQIAIALDVFADCATLACTRKRLDERAAQKQSGTLHDKLFVRHWDSWKNGTRGQLFLARLDERGTVGDEPRLLTKGLDGDVPTKPFGDDSEIAFTPDARRIVFTSRVAGRKEAWSTNLDLWSVPTDGVKPPENLTADNPATDTGPAISPDGRWLAWRAMSRPGFEADRYRVMLRDLANGQTRELAPRWDRSPDTLAWSRDGRTLYATADDLGQKRLFALDPATGGVNALTAEGTVSGFSVGPGFVVYTQNRIDAPDDLYRLGPDAAAPTQLTRHNAERLARIDFADYEQFKFAGAGDEPVYGYLVKPHGWVKGRKYPVALIVHGGPQSSMGNDFHYRWNPEVFSGMGYAVVFIDFHGSSGYGQAFTDAISGDWGGKPLEDLQKGWRHALAQYPFLDGNKACALGASYGGFMMNWIAGNWPDGFKCLVNHDGVFDQRLMYYATEEVWFPEWENGGPQYQVPENYEKHNPVNHVAKWKTPMLVVHSQNDFRVTLDQGLGAFTALQRQGVPSQFLYFPDENHWVLKPHNSIQWHETVQAWLKKWIGP